MDKKIKKMVLAALFAAITCVSTMVIKVPTIGTNGYVNIGDAAVLLSAWLLGNPYGALAAGIGSGLADILAGYIAYAPGTIIIKFAMAFVGFIIFKLMGKTSLPKPVAYIASALVAEMIMVVGYFLYESALLGYGLAAVASIPSNMIQGGTCMILGFVMIEALSKIPYVKAVVREV